MREKTERAILNITWKAIATFLFVSLLGFGGGYFVGIRGGNNRVQKAWEKAEATRIANEKTVDSLQNLKAISESEVKKLLDLREADSVKRSLERLKIIRRPRVVQLENEILEKGPVLYGVSSQDNTRRAKVASYGANAVAEVEVLRKVSEHQKVQIVYVSGIAQAEKEIRVDYQEGLKLAAEKCRNGQFKTGVAVGGGGVLLIVLGLLFL